MQSRQTFAANDLRTEAALADARLERRLDTIVPALMERHEIDAWVVTAREYAEDPVLETMLPATWLHTARRRTVLVFTERGRSRAAVSRYPVGSMFPAVWDRDAEPDQWRAVAALLADSGARTVAIDTSPTWAFADGLTATEYAALVHALPEQLVSAVVPADPLAVGWLETRLDDEIDDMVEACRLAHGLLRRALSADVITPDTTTTEDVAWWLRTAVHDLGLRVWFQPTVSVQRPDSGDRAIAGRLLPDETVVPGDLVHVDFGLVYRGLHTDQQQHAYVCRRGETEAPAAVTAGFAAANRMQDIVMEEMALGRSGNDVLAASLARAASEGIAATIYSHPIGLHGHGAGATIGLWDQQGGVPGTGDYPIAPHTAWSIELSVEVDAPGWAGLLRIMLEEDAWHDGATMRFLDGRQTAPWLI